MELETSRPDPATTDPARFTLGTLAAYYEGRPDADLCAAVRDESTGAVYPFGRFDNAKRAIHAMRGADSTLHYMEAVTSSDGFTPAAPGVDDGLFS